MLCSAAIDRRTNVDVRELLFDSFEVVCVCMGFSCYRPVVVKLNVPTYTFALLFAVTLTLNITKALALLVVKLQLVASLPLTPTVCHVFTTDVTVVDVPQAVNAPDSLLNIS